MRKNKKLLLASVAAMGALALGVGATSTFAWYQVTAQATVNSTAAATPSASLTAKESTLSAGTYMIDFAITDRSAAIDDSTHKVTLKLSQNSDGANGGTVSTMVYNTATTQTVASAGSVEDLLKGIGVTADWHIGQVGGVGTSYAKPTGDDAAYINGHWYTGAVLTVAGNVKLTSESDTLSGVKDYTSVYLRVQPNTADSGANWTFNVKFYEEEGCVNEITDLGVRINTNNPNGLEWYTDSDGQSFGGAEATHTSTGASYHYQNALSIAAVGSGLSRN